MVSCLIAGGARVEQVCLKKWMAVHEASRVGCAHVMELLLQRGGQVAETDQHGVTPLGIAAEYSHARVLELLIRHGEHQTLPSNKAPQNQKLNQSNKFQSMIHCLKSCLFKIDFFFKLIHSISRELNFYFLNYFFPILNQMSEKFVS